MAGFCRTMKEEQNSKMREYMFDYLVSLLDDAQDFSWGAAKASHAVLLCRMEQGEISDYSCMDKIDRIRRANAQRHGSPKNLSVTQKSIKSPQRSCLAIFSTKIPVLLAKHIKPKVSYIDMYVHIALALWETILGIVN